MNVQPTPPATVPATAPAQAIAHRGETISRAVADAQGTKALSPTTPEVKPEQAVKASAEAERQALEAATDKIRKFVAPLASSLEFSIDEQSGMRVVKVIDNETKEIIRQIPSEEILAIARALESLQGLLVRQNA